MASIKFAHFSHGDWIFIADSCVVFDSHENGVRVYAFGHTINNVAFFE